MLISKVFIFGTYIASVFAFISIWFLLKSILHELQSIRIMKQIELDMKNYVMDLDPKQKE